MALTPEEIQRYKRHLVLREVGGQGQQKLGYLPYAYNDFIFSTLAEEWGFLGVVVLVVLYTAIVMVGFRIARRAPDQFGELMAIAVIVMCLPALALVPLVHDRTWFDHGTHRDRGARSTAARGASGLLPLIEVLPPRPAQPHGCPGIFSSVSSADGCPGLGGAVWTACRRSSAAWTTSKSPPSMGYSFCKVL